MKQCIECDRHLFGPEPQCPFCGTVQRTTSASLGALATMTLAVGLGLSACGPQAVMEDEAGADGSGTTDPVATTAMTMVTTATTTTTTTTDGTSAASDDVDEVDDGCAGFYAGCAPDGGVDFECDLFAQDCPVGEKCMPWANDGSSAWNATRCSPLDDDPDGLGEPCTVEGNGTSGIDSCDIGLMCFDVDPETNEGECSALCMGDPSDPMCPDGSYCQISNDGALPLCIDACNPLTQDCDPGDGCYPIGELFTCAPEAEPGVYPDPCEFINVCEAGSVCLSGELIPGCTEIGCCSPLCDITVPDSCPDPGEGVICVPWWEMDAPPGYENVGACSLPP